MNKRIRFVKRYNPSEWTPKKETYEDYCERHRKAGTEPLNEIQWRRTIVDRNWPILH
jgi:hypothetical protein